MRGSAQRGRPIAGAGQVQAALQRRIATPGGATEVARAAGVSPAMISQVANGVSKMTPRIAAVLGFRLRWERSADKAAAAEATSARADREIAARAIFNRRPFRTSASGAVMDPLAATVREYCFEDAPAFYRDECYELADAVVAALTFNELREQRPLPVAA